MAPIDSVEIPEPIFVDISGDRLDGPTEIESLCVSCGENVSKDTSDGSDDFRSPVSFYSTLTADFFFFFLQGTTKLMLTKIPHYRELILMSFSCEKCGYRNNEVQSGGKIQEMGVKFKVKIKKPSDLCRQVVKSDFAAVTVPEIGLEIPSQSQKACKKLFFCCSQFFTNGGMFYCLSLS